MPESTKEQIATFLKNVTPPEVRMSMTNQHWEGAIMMYRLIEKEVKEGRDPFTLPDQTNLGG